MLQYYSPNWYFKDLIKSFFSRDVRSKTETYFKQYTKKKYVLCTGSCRTSLFLAHSVIENSTVYVSPLTCKVSLEPIYMASKMLHYVDVSMDTLNLNFDEVDHNCKVLQMSYFGGNYSNQEIRRLIELKKRGVIIIEDCAQSFSLENKTEIGSIGDIVCFSLIKNAYGIGGGIFATDNYEYFKKAQSILSSYRKVSNKKIIFRIIRNMIESKRRILFFDKLFHKLMSIRPKLNNSSMSFNSSHIYELKAFVSQRRKYEKLHKQRNKIGKIMTSCLINHQLMVKNNVSNNSFAKFFLVNQEINPEIIKRMNDKGYECKHLQNKYGSYYQLKIIRGDKLYDQSIERCINYNQIHDHIICLPLFENMKRTQIYNFVKTLKAIL